MVFFDREQTRRPDRPAARMDRRGRRARRHLEVFTQRPRPRSPGVHDSGRIEYRAEDGRRRRRAQPADRGPTWTCGSTTRTTASTACYARGRRGERVHRPARAPTACPSRIARRATLVRLYFEGKELEQRDRHRRRVGHLPRRDRGATTRRRGGARRRVRGGPHRLRGAEEPHPPRGERGPALPGDRAARARGACSTSKKQVLEARGNPQLEDRGDTLRGKSLAYDLESRRGTVFGARTRYQTGWYAGDKIRRLGDDVLDVSGARYSTCNLDEPHYAFRSDRMKIYLKDKIIARPVVFALQARADAGAAVLRVPDPRRTAHSGLLVPQIQFGFGDETGGYIRNAGYYWAPNDYIDFTVSRRLVPVDPVVGAARRGALQGCSTSSRARCRARSRARTTATEERNWDFRGQHAQTIDENTSLTARANFTSSADYTRDPLTGLPLANRIDRFLTSNLTLSHRRPWASINLVAVAPGGPRHEPDHVAAAQAAGTAAVAVDRPAVAHAGQEARAVGRAVVPALPVDARTWASTRASSTIARSRPSSATPSPACPRVRHLGRRAAPTSTC